MKLTRGWRIALSVGAVAIAAVAFVFARPSGDDEEPPVSATTEPTLTDTTVQAETDAATAAPDPATPAPAPTPSDSPSPQPAEPGPSPASPSPEPVPVEPEPVPLTRIRIENGAPVGGIQEISAKKGDQVRFNILSDLPDEIHLHGYDITRTVTPGSPARFRFSADFEGVFEVEAHDAGHVIVARVVIEP